jgi:hypothetical protein
MAWPSTYPALKAFWARTHSITGVLRVSSSHRYGSATRWPKCVVAASTELVAGYCGPGLEEAPPPQAAALRVEAATSIARSAERPFGMEVRWCRGVLGFPFMDITSVGEEPGARTKPG